MSLVKKVNLSVMGIVLALAGVVSAQNDISQTNAVPVEVKPLSQNQTESATQDALVQTLLKRIEQLEAREAQKAETAQKEEAAKTQKLLQRIGELEEKVGSLEAGRVLPEITVSSDDSPSSHDLDQKIRILERKNELALEAAEARAKETPKLSIGQNGFAFTSADTNFALKIKGLIQLDSRTFFNDHPLSEGNDSFILRRVRPIFEGTVFRDFDFQLVPDFGGSSVQVFDANLNYRFKPELQLRAGKFKGPVGLEMLQSDATLPFNERSLVSALVPTRNLGVELWGDVAEGKLNYALGVFNGAGDGRNSANNDFNDNKEFAARLFLQPFKETSLTGLSGLGFGIGGSYSQVNSNALGLPNGNGYSTDGQQQFFAYNPVAGTVLADGAHWRLSPQATYTYGPFGLLGEYAISHQNVLNANGLTLRKAELEHTAWQVSAQWVLTGEPASFTGLTPKRPFSPSSGGWGAWQLVARYGQLNIDDAAFPVFSNPTTSANSATVWSVGINWWLNKNVRVLTSFSHTVFDGGGVVNPLDLTTLVPPATVTHQNENALFTRIQLAF